MGLFKKKSRAVLPDECSNAIYAYISKALDLSNGMREHIVIAVTPCNREGRVEYRDVKGLAVFWSGDSLVEKASSYPIEKYHDLLDDFHVRINDWGEREMYFWYFLPENGIGDEAAYMSFFANKLKSDYPDARVGIGSKGRQLTISNG